MTKFLATLLGLAALLGAADARSQTADTSPNTLYVHGNVLTGSHLAGEDKSTTPMRVTAFAVTNSSVVAVGSDAEMLKLKGEHTEVVDLHGAFVMPGFNDAHTHIAAAGQQKLSVDLDAAPSLADMLERIRSYTAAAKPGQWIQGAGWDQTIWTVKTLPTRQDLDKVTAGHPAVFYRTDGHIVVANSAALAAAGITSASVAPAGAQIDKDAAGELTGIVREAPAIALILARVPPPDSDFRKRALVVAMDDAVAHGVTSLQDNSTWDDWLSLETMERQGELKLRVSEWLDFNQPLAVLKERRASHDEDDPLLHLAMLKAFMDGSLGSRTAALAAPYSDDAENSGLLRYEQEKLNQMAAERAAAGFQLGFHAIGDEANEMALNAFQAADQVAVAAQGTAFPQHHDSTGATLVVGPRNLRTELRFRVEHAQVLLPEDFGRFQALGVIASMQPSHLLTDMQWAGARLGPERSRYAYAWRSMLQHGVVLAFGTDYPVESISPFRGLYSAVTRQNEAGTQTFQAQERLSMAEAIYAYTQGSAFAEYRETRQGRLEPGFLADFVVLDRDPMAVAPRQILGTRVLRTVVGGKTVFQAVDQRLATPPPAVPTGRTATPEVE